MAVSDSRSWKTTTIAFLGMFLAAPSEAPEHARKLDCERGLIYDAPHVGPGSEVASKEAKWQQQIDQMRQQMDAMVGAPSMKPLAK